jgi:hypothetical protein
MRGRVVGGLLAAAVLFSGCASETFAPEAAPEFVVIRDRVAFYRFGPAQAGRPEAELSRSQRVRVLRKEFGYSLVQLEDERVGYVANEDIAPAPPEEQVSMPVEPIINEEAPSRTIIDDAPLPAG